MQHGTPLRDKARGVACPGRTQPAEEEIASSGITFHLCRLSQHAWLVCLLFPFASFAREPLSLWRLTARLLALRLFAATYTWLMWPPPRSRWPLVRALAPLSFR